MIRWQFADAVVCPEPMQAKHDSLTAPPWAGYDYRQVYFTQSRDTSVKILGTRWLVGIVARRRHRGSDRAAPARAAGHVLGVAREHVSPLPDTGRDYGRG